MGFERKKMAFLLKAGTNQLSRVWLSPLLQGIARHLEETTSPRSSRPGWFVHEGLIP